MKKLSAVFSILFLLCVVFNSPKEVFAIVGDVQLDVSTGGQIIGSALTTNKFTDAANTDYYLDPAAATTSLTVAGSVGIGTTSPGYSLEVAGASGFGVTSSIPAGTYGAKIIGASGAARDIFLAGQSGVSNGFTVQYDGSAMKYTFNGGNVYFPGTGIWNSSGNVGIGTGSPIVSLDTAGDFKWQDVRSYKTSRSWGANINDWGEIGSFANTGVSQYGIIKLQGHWCGSIISSTYKFNSAGYGGTSTGWVQLPIADGGGSYWSQNAVAVDVRNQNPGSTSSPIEARLRNLQGMCGGTGLYIYVETNTAFTPTTGTGTGGTVENGYLGSINWSFPVSNGRGWTSATEGMFVTNAGNVGIGTNAPGYLLTVNSSTPGCNGCTAWTNYSDIRLKDNIESLSGSVLDKIMDLKPVTFNYNDTYYSQTGYSRPDGKTPTFTGFVAQDLQQIFPEMVSTANSGYLDTNLSGLQIYLVKGMQEQQKKLDTQQKEIDDLNKKIEKLEKLIEAK